MKIVICGSTSFREEKIEIRDRLRLLGHEPIIDPWTEKIVKGDEELKKAVEKKHSEVKKKFDLIRWYYNSIFNSDAVLIVNLEKTELKII